MSNFMGFVYGLFAAADSKNERPLSEEEIIIQQHLLRQLDDHAVEPQDPGTGVTGEPAAQKRQWGRKEARTARRAGAEG